MQDDTWRRPGRRYYSTPVPRGRWVGRLLLLLAGLWLLAWGARADVLVPLKVELSVYPDGRYGLVVRGDLLRLLAGPDWRGSARGREAARRLAALSDAQLGEYLREHPRLLARRLALRLDGRRVQPAVRSARWRDGPPEGEIRLGGALAGQVQSIDFGYARSLGKVVFRYRRYDPERAAWSAWQWLDRRTAHAAPANGPAPAATQVVGDYLWLGFTHIVPKGLDHILFIVGLFLLSTGWRTLITQISLFTLAHTLTLGLTTWGTLRLSPQVVEPLIALSIAWVGVEGLWRRRVGPWRWAVVFAFGLLHGMGFAGVLGELGLPRERFLLALLSFNGGVELGQLAVLLACALLVAWPLRRRPGWYRRGVVAPASLAIAVTGAVWAVQRVQLLS